VAQLAFAFRNQAAKAGAPRSGGGAKQRVRVRTRALVGAFNLVCILIDMLPGLTTRSRSLRQELSSFSAHFTSSCLSENSRTRPWSKCCAFSFGDAWGACPAKRSLSLRKGPMGRLAADGLAQERRERLSQSGTASEAHQNLRYAGIRRRFFAPRGLFRRGVGLDDSVPWRLWFYSERGQVLGAD
jgi:hypothetical protein